MQIYQWSSEVVEDICSLQQLGVKQATCPDHRGRLPLCAVAVQSATHHQDKVQHRMHHSIGDSCNPVHLRVHCIINRGIKMQLQQGGKVKV
nr:hypothetical protein CFP56_72479 [Quercus suber]